MISGWDIECLQEWGAFFNLSVFGLLMIIIEWWSFEVGIFLAGNIFYQVYWPVVVVVVVVVVCLFSCFADIVISSLLLGKSI